MCSESGMDWKVGLLTSNNFSTRSHESRAVCFIGYLICRLNKTHGSPLRPLSSVASLAFNANWSKTIMEFIRTYWTPEQALTIRGLLSSYVIYICPMFSDCNFIFKIRIKGGTANVEICHLVLIFSHTF